MDRLIADTDATDHITGTQRIRSPEIVRQRIAVASAGGLGVCVCLLQRRRHSGARVHSFLGPEAY